jgi:3-oxoacyl-[acyl-carrier-protein] synthase-3
MDTRHKKPREGTLLGIQEIASYIPEGRISNYERKGAFKIDDSFLEEKIGVKRVSVKVPGENTSDLCVEACVKLMRKTGISPADIETVAVVTQNPDTNIPHTSAIVHGKLELPERCASFDISLGCSGYLYGLSIVLAFMKENGFTKGILLTADPYSKIIDRNDKNTSLLFGDAAAATLISDRPIYTLEDVTFGTLGKRHRDIMCSGGTLTMNGRGIFDFAAKYIPGDIRSLLARNGLGIEQVDRFVFHQGSKFIIDTLAKRLILDRQKVAYDIYEYGNTVSSSIPIILEKEIDGPRSNTVVISGFGVGLSWSSGILRKARRTP